jgi:chorismate mutase
MKLPGECSSKEEIRQEIDRIDENIISLLGERLNYVKEIVKYKSNSIEVKAQERFDEVINSRRDQAIKHGISPEVVNNVYNILLDYFIMEQNKILEKRAKH